MGKCSKEILCLMMITGSMGISTTLTPSWGPSFFNIEKSDLKIPNNISLNSYLKKRLTSRITDTHLFDHSVRSDTSFLNWNRSAE